MSETILIGTSATPLQEKHLKGSTRAGPPAPSRLSGLLYAITRVKMKWTILHRQNIHYNLKSLFRFKHLQ